MDTLDFLPVSREDMHSRDWWYYDFLVVTADAYIDHPSFGTAIIARVLEAEGYRVAVLSQPDWHSPQAFLDMGKPRYGVLIGGGNIDSMVAHYTAAKKRRSSDAYSPGSKMGLRPDRPTIVYANRAREAFPGTPIVIGGLEASLRRFAHYDYWDDKVRRSILLDAGADLLVYGMGERATREIARRLSKGEDVKTLTDIRGTAYFSHEGVCAFDAVAVPSFEAVCADKHDYALATKIEYEEHDAVRGKAILQPHGSGCLVVNPPAMPLNQKELDAVYALPFAREVHPMYDEQGGVAAIEEVRFSVAHNRGCFGGCNFCSLAFHQGRMVTSRSHESVLKEVEGFTHDPKFKGYVHDIGGPTANFRHPSCQQQLKNGMCKHRACLAPTPCPNLDPSHQDYLQLLRKVRAIPGVKKVFIRSGIRFDYMLCEKNSEFFSDLVRHHVSGQLKVAPEHCASRVLDYMGKQVRAPEPALRPGAVHRALPHEQPPGVHPGRRGGTGAVPQQDRPPARAGPGLLPHPGDPLHLHVVHRHRPPDHGAGLCGPGPPRKGPPARPFTVEAAGDAPPGDGGAAQGRAHRPHRLREGLPHPPPPPQRGGAPERREGPRRGQTRWGIPGPAEKSSPYRGERSGPGARAQKG